jgi:hypothetical protein
MTILNVNHKFARANHEKRSERMLYWFQVNETENRCELYTYNALQMEEEHPDGTMARFIKAREMYNCILF